MLRPCMPYLCAPVLVHTGMSMQDGSTKTTLAQSTPEHVPIEIDDYRSLRSLPRCICGLGATMHLRYTVVVILAGTAGSVPTV